MPNVFISTDRSYIEANRSAIEELIAEARPTLEWEAAWTLAQRQHVVLCWCAADATGTTWLSDRMEGEQESAFRRGYQHGYSQAMDDLKPGSRAPLWQAIARWFDDVLTPWRYGKAQSMGPVPSFGASRRSPPPPAPAAHA